MDRGISFSGLKPTSSLSAWSISWQNSLLLVVLVLVELGCKPNIGWRTFIGFPIRVMIEGGKCMSVLNLILLYGGGGVKKCYVPRCLSYTTKEKRIFANCPVTIKASGPQAFMSWESPNFPDRIIARLRAAAQRKHEGSSLSWAFVCKCSLSLSIIGYWKTLPWGNARKEKPRLCSSCHQPWSNHHEFVTTLLFKSSVMYLF